MLHYFCGVQSAVLSGDIPALPILVRRPDAAAHPRLVAFLLLWVLSRVWRNGRPPRPRRLLRPLLVAAAAGALHGAAAVAYGWAISAMSA